MSSLNKLNVVSIGHTLADIRFVVNEFVGPDQEGVILKQSRGAGGSAANVAIDVRRLGLRSGIIAKVGLDGFGRLIVDELMKEGVDVSGLKVGFDETGFTIVVINGKGETAMYGFKGAAGELSPVEVDATIIGRAEFVHIASLRIDTSLKAATIAKDMDKKVSWDPGRVLSMKGIRKLEALIRLVDIALVNERECMNLTGKGDYRIGAEEIRDLGPELVVIKRGARGVYVLSDELNKEFPAYVVPNPIDTTGAGDAFAAGLLTGFSRKYDLERSITYALAVASLKVRRLGSHEIPTHEDVMEFLHEHNL